MKLFLQISCLRTLLNELLNQFQLLSITSFESTGIMKDQARVALKYHFVLNVMLPPLWCGYIIEHKSLIRKLFLTFKDGLRANDLTWDYGQWMSVSGIKFQDMPHLFTIQTEDCRFFCHVAESLQDCCLACISPPDHKDTESSKLCSDFLNLLCSKLRLWWGRHCERCCWCGMIRPFKLLSQEHLVQVILILSVQLPLCLGHWKSMQQCPSCFFDCIWGWFWMNGR